MRQKRFLCLKGILFAWLFTILFAAGGQQVCFAAEENIPQQTVYDDAALLTPEEIETLEGELDAAGEKTGWNILMLTTDDTNGKTTQEYADDRNTTTNARFKHKIDVFLFSKCDQFCSLCCYQGFV